MNEHMTYFENAIEACLACGLCTRIQEESGCIAQTYADYARGMLEAVSTGRFGDVTYATWSCTLCGACTARCPAGIDAYEFVHHARCVLNPEQPSLIAEFASMRPDLESNSYRRLREIRKPSLTDALCVDAPCKKLLFPGCSLSTYAPELTGVVFGHLHDTYDVGGITFKCCGNPYYFMGDSLLSHDWASNLAEELNSRDTEEIIVACPSCYTSLCDYRENGILDDSLRIVPLPTVLAEQGAKVDPRATEQAGYDSLCIKDACRDRASGVFAESVRQILGDANITELKHNRRNSRCCGSGGLVPLYDEEASEDKRWLVLEEFDDTETSCLATVCMNCAFSLRQNGDTNIVHYLELLFGEYVNWDRLQEDVQETFAR